MRRALQQIPEDEPRSYVDRIRELVEQERIGAARALVAEAAALGAREEGLEGWQKVLAPAKVLRRLPADEPDRTEDIRWLDTHWQEYRGQWVALLGGELLAYAASLKDVLAKLGERSVGKRALLHRIP